MKFSIPFISGLIIRIALIAFAIPAIAHQWFVPFLSETPLSFDLWSAHLAAGGDVLSFPYGIIMALVLLPGTLIAGGVGLGLSLLVFDLLTYRAMCRLILDRRLVDYFYWLSPLALYVTYYHGQLDIVPVCLLVWGLVFLSQKRFYLASFWIAVSLAAKLSMILAVPFVFIYLWRNRKFRQVVPNCLGIFAAICGPLIVGLYAFSPGARQMVFATPEAQKIFDLSLSIGPVLHLYLVPIIYILLTYMLWRLKRINFDLLMGGLGLAFLSVVLLTPSSAGWVLWVLPFLVWHIKDWEKTGLILLGLFSTVFIGFHLFVSSGAVLPFADLRLPVQHISNMHDPHLTSLFVTLLVGVGFVLGARIVRQGIAQNDYFRISRRPVLIGIAGDSGAGKDTLAESLMGLFGTHSVTHISGDNYHNWDRGGAMWQAMTHLNPRANDLTRFCKDVLKLLDGKRVKASHYDHATGHRTHNHIIKPNDILIATGLHALYQPLLNKRYDVRIFLKPDEDLRRYWKIQRDCTQRGHALEKVEASIQARMGDGQDFIAPQEAAADIVFTLFRPGQQDDDGPLHLGLRALIKDCVYHESLARTLIADAGMNVDILPKNGHTLLTIKGWVSADMIEKVAQSLIPRLSELSDNEPDWEGSMLGIMQLIGMLHLSHKLEERLS